MNQFVMFKLFEIKWTLLSSIYVRDGKNNPLYKRRGHFKVVLLKYHRNGSQNCWIKSTTLLLLSRRPSRISPNYPTPNIMIHAEGHVQKYLVGPCEGDVSLSFLPMRFTVKWVVKLLILGSCLYHVKLWVGRRIHASFL